jgi:hypothetical protein
MTTLRFSPRVTFQGVGILLTLSHGRASESLNLGVPNFNNIILPYFLAIERGYYRDEGIDLQLIPVNGARPGCSDDVSLRFRSRSLLEINLQTLLRYGHACELK